MAGYVSFKCRNYSICKYSYGGFASKENSIEKGAFSEWVSRISKGFLTKPSELFWQQVQLMEKDFFENFSENNHSKLCPLIKSINSKYPDIPNQLVHTFLRTR